MVKLYSGYWKIIPSNADINFVKIKNCFGPFQDVLKDHPQPEYINVPLGDHQESTFSYLRGS